MNEQQVFSVVKSTVVEVLGISPDEVTPERSLVELGANSLDRVEVTMCSMEALGVSVPRSELQGIQNLRGLVQIFCRHLEA